MIQVLSPQIVDKIAAGEVIERPASLVKELIENALDAGAHRIDIEIEGAGSRLVRVTDDGCGLDADELELVFVSHATSKLSCLEDLEEIASLGFRGEALASIGAVSRARVRSRRATHEAGSEIEDQGGRIVGPRAVGMPPGTVVEVRDLFFNTPARRKFLKTEATERAHVVEVVTRLSLAHPDVRFRLTRDGRTVYAAEGDDDVVRRLRNAYGTELGQSLVSGDVRVGWGHLDLYLAKPDQARRRARLQLTFVNGRSVRDRMLMAAVRQGYAEFLADSLQPAYALFLTMPPADVDVNVHPTKAEVRFRRGREIFGDVMRSVSRVLQGADLAPRPRLGFGQGRSGSRGSEPPTVAPGTAGALAVRGERSRGPSLFGSATPMLDVTSSQGGDHPVDRVAEETTGPGSEPVVPRRGESVGPAATGGVLQVHGTYLLYETPEGLMVVDQHALHERLVYNRLRRQFERGRILSQRLVEPYVVEVPRRQVLALEGAGKVLSRLGVELRPFGETTVALSAVPALLERFDPQCLVAEILDQIENDEMAEENRRLVERTLFTMACHRAVRGGDRLSEAAARRLLREAEGNEITEACPHGRPTRVLLPLAEFERLFKRRGF